MSVYSFSISPPPLSLLKPKKHSCLYNSPNYPSSTFKCQLSVTLEDVAAVAQNKVLIAAGLSAAIGQFAKPFTSVLLYGNSLDFRAFIQAGGFPSTHSSAVVAAATALALERGFSDSIFGVTLVYAALVMYDAQGVRREVGIHAKVINRLILDGRLNSITEADEDIIDSAKSSNLGSLNMSEKLYDGRKDQTASPLLLESRLQKSMAKIGKDKGRTNSYPLLKESIGHTEVEVIAGALLGFLVSLTFYAIM